jgi:hypothetical protein
VSETAEAGTPHPTPSRLQATEKEARMYIGSGVLLLILLIILLVWIF